MVYSFDKASRNYAKNHVNSYGEVVSFFFLFFLYSINSFYTKNKIRFQGIETIFLGLKVAYMSLSSPAPLSICTNKKITSIGVGPLRRERRTKQKHVHVY